MAKVQDSSLAAILPSLEEAARAHQRTVERFVAPRPGIVEQVSARRHQFVLGRRGVGKSTLLLAVERRATESGTAVASIDLETLRGIPYPDVLIHLLVSVLKALQERLASLASEDRIARRLRLRRVARSIGRVERELSNLLADPQTMRKTVSRLQRTTRRSAAKGSVDLALPRIPGAVGVSADRSGESSKSEAAEAEFEHTKMDGLYAAAWNIRGVLEKAIQALESHSAIIILDGFYHIRSSDQPSVLGYLHQVVKNLDIYMKVGAVSHRLVPFVEGDPPTGVQIGHDAGEVTLDLTLEQFTAAQGFLERVLTGLLQPLGFAIDDVITEGGRTRLVLASGGVARDYLNLTAQALRVANERESRANRPHNKITAEDVNAVSQHLQEQKQSDLLRDSGPNADNLRARFSELVKFCLDRNKTNVFVVETNRLGETAWGREIDALADLRFVHRVGPVSIQSSDYRGRQFTAFTLDLSSYTGTRSERIRQIDFWTGEGREQLRRVGLIYVAGRVDAGTVVEAVAPPVDWSQEPLPGL